MNTIEAVATVGGVPVPVAEVDAREAALRAGPLGSALPAPGTSEGRQLRRWLTQLLVTERVVAAATALPGCGTDADTDAAAEHAAIPDATADAPPEREVMPDATARLELGSVASAVLTADPRARALFARLARGIEVTEEEITAYHRRNPDRFARPRRTADGWLRPPDESPPLHEVRDAVEAELRGAAARRTFLSWLDARRAELVHLAPGYEHPGDPRQPDNTHRH